MVLLTVQFLYPSSVSYNIVLKYIEPGVDARMQERLIWGFGKSLPFEMANTEFELCILTCGGSLHAPNIDKSKDKLEIGLMP